MFSYRVFNLNIVSEIQIPHFPVSNELDPDARICYGDVRGTAEGEFENENVFCGADGAIYFFWDRIGWFRIRDGNEIVVEPHREAEIEIIRLALSGITFAALLQQRRLLVLHASAVSIGGAAVVFIGWKGAGKSTSAAALYGRGHSMISDDIVGIEDNLGICSVLPAFPSFKLMPEGVANIFADDPESLSRICVGAEKRFRPSADNFVCDTTPLKAIYVLEEGPELTITRLSPQRSLAALIANTYLARYGRQLLQGDYAAHNLRQCSKLLNSAPIYHLIRPKSFHELDEFIESVEKSHGDDPLVELEANRY